ncbi:MAG: hypothetical protein WCJ61_13175 [Paludibacter sp.]
MANEQKVTKITEDELQLLNLIRQDALETASTLGELNYQKIILDIQVEQQVVKIKDIRSREEVFFSDLREKYGNVSINIATGDFL